MQEATSKSVVITKKKGKQYVSRAFSSSLLHAIMACNHLPFFKIFSNFVHFCTKFQIFCPFCSFLPFYWKIACMPLLSRIGPGWTNHIHQPGAFTPTKVTPVFDITDEPIIQCEVPVAENTFVFRWWQINDKNDK